MGRTPIRSEMQAALDAVTDDELISYVADTFGFVEDDLRRALQVQKATQERIWIGDTFGRMLKVSSADQTKKT